MWPPCCLFLALPCSKKPMMILTGRKEIIKLTTKNTLWSRRLEGVLFWARTSKSGSLSKSSPIRGFQPIWSFWLRTRRMAQCSLEPINLMERQIGNSERQSTLLIITWKTTARTVSWDSWPLLTLRLLNLTFTISKDFSRFKQPHSIKAAEKDWISRILYGEIVSWRMVRRTES